MILGHENTSYVRMKRLFDSIPSIYTLLSLFQEKRNKRKQTDRIIFSQISFNRYDRNKNMIEIKFDNKNEK